MKELLAAEEALRDMEVEGQIVSGRKDKSSKKTNARSMALD